MSEQQFPLDSSSFPSLNFQLGSEGGAKHIGFVHKYKSQSTLRAELLNARWRPVQDGVGS